MMKYFFFAIVIAMFAAQAYALNVEITTKQSFELGEQISFNYTITSDSEESVMFVSYVSCPNGPGDMPEQLTVFVSKEQPYTGKRLFLSVDESFETQTCRAIVSITSPVEKDYTQDFNVIGVPRFDFTIQTCKDSECAQNTNTFFIGDIIYVIANSEKTPNITAIITKPDGYSQNLAFSNGYANFMPQSTGTYTINIVAELTGYKTEKIELQLTVSDSIPVITDTSVCNGDFICDENETPQNCPQDCARTQDTDLIYIFMFAGIVVIFAVMYVSIRRRK